jgi:DNA-binding NarL/FixJ family response regulator
MEPRPAGAGRLNIAIVDDHPLVREGLAARINAQPDMEVCGEADDIESAMELIVAARPSLVIVDIALRDGHGIDLIKRIVAAGINTRMLVVSAYDESLFAERALRAGALGYINKQELQGKVIEALRTVLRGERYLSSTMAQRLIAQAIGSKAAAGGTEALTDRELQIFQLVGRARARARLPTSSMSACIPSTRIASTFAPSSICATAPSSFSERSNGTWRTAEG